MALPMLSLLLSSLALAGTADRAWIFVIDGLRESEGVAAGGEQLPWLWEIARGRGVLVDGLVNRDSTQTDGAHRVAFTGRRQPTGGLPWYEGHAFQRAFTPTIFEMVGRARGAATAGVIEGNTVFMDTQGRSLYPGLQAIHVVEGPVGDLASGTDVEVAASVIATVATDAPPVVGMNLHEADKNGHASEWDLYLTSTEGADAVIQSFAEQYVGEHDAVFVFADHGRHLNEGWAGHSDTCAGCRTSFLFAWGEGIPAGVRVHGGWELADIAPTIAAVLGVELPHARGRPILPVLSSPPPTPAEEDLLVDPALVADAAGGLHLFAARRGDAEAGPGVVHRTSDDGGKTWTSAGDGPLADGTETPEDVRAMRAGDALVVSWRAWDGALGTWGLYAARYAAGAWGAAETVDADVFHATLPTLAADADGELHGWSWDEVAGIADGVADFLHYADAGGWTATVVDGGGLFHLPTEIALVPDGDALVGVFAAIAAEQYVERNANRDIWVARDAAGEAPSFVRVTTDDEVSYWPSLARDDAGGLHLAWATRVGASLDESAWRVRYARSTDGGATWSSAVRVDAGTEAWRPLVVTRGTDVGVAWVEVEGTVHRVRMAPVVDGEPGEPVLVAEEDAVIDGLSAAAVDGGFVLAWSEGSGTLRHRLRTARVRVDGTDLDTPLPAPVTEAPEPGSRCGCDAGGSAGVTALAAVALALAGARRRRATVP